jgi:hypothetical protein
MGKEDVHIEERQGVNREGHYNTVDHILRFKVYISERGGLLVPLFRGAERFLSSQTQHAPKPEHKTWTWSISEAWFQTQTLLAHKRETDMHG